MQMGWRYVIKKHCQKILFCTNQEFKSKQCHIVFKVHVNLPLLVDQKAAGLKVEYFAEKRSSVKVDVTFAVIIKQIMILVTKPYTHTVSRFQGKFFFLIYQGQLIDVQLSKLLLLVGWASNKAHYRTNYFMESNAIFCKYGISARNTFLKTSQKICPRNRWGNIQGDPMCHTMHTGEQVFFSLQENFAKPRM